MSKVPLAFNPYQNIVTYPANGAANPQAGNLAAEPILAGKDAQEGRVFQYGQTNLTAFLAVSFGATTPQIIPAIQANFPVGTTPGINTSYEAISAIYTLAAFQWRRPLHERKLLTQGVPTWRYFYNAQFPKLVTTRPWDFTTLRRFPLRLARSQGVPVNPVTLAPTGLIPTNLQPIAQEAALSSFMNAAGANFAKNPTAGPGWDKLGTYGGQLSSHAILGLIRVDFACLMLYSLVNVIQAKLLNLADVVCSSEGIRAEVATG